MSRRRDVVGIVIVTILMAALAVAGLSAQLSAEPPLMACADQLPKDGTLSVSEMRTALLRHVMAVSTGRDGCDMDTNAVTNAADSRLLAKAIRERLATLSPVVTEASACGDGVLQGEETCDDANTVDGDGCSAACSRETLRDEGGIVLLPDGVRPIMSSATRWRALGAETSYHALRDDADQSAISTGIQTSPTQTSYAYVVERLTLEDPQGSPLPVREAFVDLRIDRGWGFQREMYPLQHYVPSDVDVRNLEVSLVYNAGPRLLSIELGREETLSDGARRFSGFARADIDVAIHAVKISSLRVRLSSVEEVSPEAKVESGLRNRCHGTHDAQYFRDADGGCAYIVNATASGEEGTVFSAEQKWTGFLQPERYCEQLVEGGRDDWSLPSSSIFMSLFSPRPLAELRSAIGLTSTYYPVQGGMFNSKNGSVTTPRDASIRSVFCVAPLRGPLAVPEGILVDDRDERFSTFTWVPEWAWKVVQEPRAIGGTVTQVDHSVGRGVYEERTRAAWRLHGMAPGLYDVFVTWVPRPSGDWATFTSPVVENFGVIDTLHFRTNPPYGMGGRGWHRTLVRIGEDGSTTMELSGGGGGLMQADAIVLRKRDGDASSVPQP